MEGAVGGGEVNTLRILDLPTGWTILLDILIWTLIHFAVVIAMLSLPIRLFDIEAWPFRARFFEFDGRLYERGLRVRAWKHRLPDGADILPWRGFPKRQLEQRSVAYLDRFARETCRAELTHILTMIWAPLFFLWNPVWVGFVMIGYALAENLPLIVAQRYNRIRLARILAAHAAREKR